MADEREQQIRERLKTFTPSEYAPFDQDTKLSPPPWKADDPALIAWERAHGHDVRLKCYVELGCVLVEESLESDLAYLLDALAAAREELAESWRVNFELNQAVVDAGTAQANALHDLAAAREENGRLQEALVHALDRYECDFANEENETDCGNCTRCLMRAALPREDDGNG